MCGIKVGSVQRVVENLGFTVTRAAKAKPGDVNSEYRFYLLAIHDRNGQAVEVSAPNPNFQSQRGVKTSGKKIDPDKVTVKVLDHHRRKFVIDQVEVACFDSVKGAIYKVAKGAYKRLAA